MSQNANVLLNLKQDELLIEKFMEQTSQEHINKPIFSTQVKPATILIVDDDKDVLAALLRVLHRVDATLVSFSSASEALNFCQGNCPDIVLSDQRMPEMDGCEFLSRVKELWPNSQRIILSAYQDFQKVSAAFNSGIIERYICKPWDNKELLFIINSAINVKPLVSTENSPQDDEFINTPINFHGIVTADEVMRELFVGIRRASTTNAPIFITGETGTGKELVSHACHKESYYKDEPFIAVNCANFTEHLIESQLFGHVKGAFTGATSSQEGVFYAAKKGTLFLDEITTLTKTLQAKLLRVVQEREFSPLGSNTVVKFNAQIISASSNSIGQAVMDGDFREDLYYRLNVITFALPPLRDRGSDVILIARYFLKKYAKIENKTFNCFSKDALQIICQYDWPGNIRQLENVIHGMVILNSGEQITSEMIIKSLSTTVKNYNAIQPTLPLPVTQTSSSHQSNPSNYNPSTANNDNHANIEIRPLWQIEKDAIEAAILHCQGNIPKAAAMLEVSPSTIYRKKLDW